jgi:hypothetical protein
MGITKFMESETNMNLSLRQILLFTLYNKLKKGIQQLCPKDIILPACSVYIANYEHKSNTENL